MMNEGCVFLEKSNLLNEHSIMMWEVGSSVRNKTLLSSSVQHLLVCPLHTRVRSSLPTSPLLTDCNESVELWMLYSFSSRAWISTPWYKRGFWARMTFLHKFKAPLKKNSYMRWRVLSTLTQGSDTSIKGLNHQNKTCKMIHPSRVDLWTAQYVLDL